MGSLSPEGASGSAGDRPAAAFPARQSWLWRWTSPLRRRSIRLLLSAASLIFLLQVIALGIYSNARLSDVNGISNEIRSQWLQDTRLLGDLNNYMSDDRAGEGTFLLSGNPREVSDSAREITALDATVARVQRAYEALPHEADEWQLYGSFERQWLDYKSLARKVQDLKMSGHTAEAVAMYMTSSRHAFDLASDTLGALTDHTIERARDASERAQRIYERDRALILAAMALATCLVATTIIYITRSVSSPLLGLARRMHELADHRLDVEIPGLTREDEIGEMARSVGVFRDNAVELHRSQRRLIEQATALETTLEKERRVMAEQRNFVTMTSHEFRTPLTVIDAQAQRLVKLRHRISPEDLADRAQRIRSAVLRLTGIMDSLLGSSRLFDGQAIYSPEKFDPRNLAHEVCQLHRETSRGADIREELDSLPGTVTGDPRLLFALLSNLVSNALKYSTPGRPVSVIGSTSEPGTWSISVHDQGIGIPERDREHLFERYFRGTNTTHVAGSGVGLHLVAIVAALHGGTVCVDSREGAGSIFTVRLPIDSAPGTSAGAVTPQRVPAGAA